MYREGRCVPKDDKIAVKWYTLTLKRGHAIAQNNLGLMYGKKHAITQDYKTAVKYYRLAAEQGYSRAQWSLGVMYGDGQGVNRTMFIHICGTTLL
jgi:hypothetical protein